MVDVSAKDVTVRTATASGRVLLSPAAVAAMRDGNVPKGDALAVGPDRRIAGPSGDARHDTPVPPAGHHGVTVDLTVEDATGVAYNRIGAHRDRTGSRWRR